MPARFVQTGPNAVPMVVIPLVGGALASILGRPRGCHVIAVSSGGFKLEVLSVRSRETSALLPPAPPEPRHQAAQPAPDLLARVSGDPADRVVGLDDSQLLVRRALGAPSGDRLGG